MSDACPVAAVRWGQTANYGYVPNDRQKSVFMAVAVDLGDPASPFGDIHPRYKQPVGARLALAGRAVAYGESTLYYTGPLVSGATAGGAKVVVTFRNTGTAGLELHSPVRP